MALPAKEALALLERAFEKDRLTHACLITGPAGSGKRALALSLARKIVGAEGDSSSGHVDVHTVQPESKSRRIVVEQVRGLESDLRMRALGGGAKVGIIFDAERLQPQAANAFLKTLEEPPGQSHLILVSSLPEQLLETVVSRCMEITLAATGRREHTGRERELLEILAAGHRSAAMELPGVYGLVREFQRLLGESKDAAREETEKKWKAEEQRYKQMADHAWLEEREEQFKAIAEAQYLAERSVLIEMLEGWWADILRQQVGAENLDFPEQHEATWHLATLYTPEDALNRSLAVERLRSHLGNPGIQEPLAIEVAFNQAFGQL